MGVVMFGGYAGPGWVKFAWLASSKIKTIETGPKIFAATFECFIFSIILPCPPVGGALKAASFGCGFFTYDFPTKNA